jgi:hypothetical protein
MDLAWENNIGITQVASSSNSINVKLVRYLNKKGVCHIVAKTFWMSTTQSTNFLDPSSSWSFRRFLELRTLKARWKNITTFWSISSNNISLSLEEKVHALEEESWLELEDNILFT